MQQNSLPKPSDSELKFFYDAISKALANQILNNGQPDISESLNILNKFYNKDNPLIEINEKLPMFGSWTPLAIAAYYNNSKALQFLIKNGAKVNFSHDNMTYPLHLASAKANEVCIMLLLKAGADKNKIDAKGKTPLMRACENKELKRTTVELFFNNFLSKDELDLNIMIQNKGCIDIAKESGSPEIASFLSYILLKNKLVSKGISEREKRFKI